MGYDVIWELFKTLTIVVWFIGAGLVSSLIVFKFPTRKIFKRFFNY